jgi:hypothetical protein
MVLSYSAFATGEVAFGRTALDAFLVASLVSSTEHEVLDQLESNVRGRLVRL